MATDEVVPREISEHYSSWCLTRDEFRDCDGWSYALYIREGRRLVADYVVDENDCRNLKKCDGSIGLGSYNMDSHNVTRFVDENGFVRNEGDMQKPPKPLRIVKDHHLLHRRMLVDRALGRDWARHGIFVAVDAVAVQRLSIDQGSGADDGSDQ